MDGIEIFSPVSSKSPITEELIDFTAIIIIIIIVVIVVVVIIFVVVVNVFVVVTRYLTLKITNIIFIYRGHYYHYDSHHHLQP